MAGIYPDDNSGCTLAIGIIIMILLAAIVGVWYIISPDTLNAAREYITNLIAY